jgi:hypothetical protein
MYRDLEKQMYQHIENGDWDSAINTALRLPTNWDALQRLPSSGEMPEYAINMVLNRIERKPDLGTGFLFELASNLPENLSAETLNRLAYASRDSHYEQEKFMGHPNFKYTEQYEPLKQAADWWNGYEKAVDPKHFATVKSMLTGAHESIKDHRGNTGESESHILPHLKAYAQEVQRHVMNDDFLKKKNIGGEPHVLVHRGVGGNYAKHIKNALAHDHISNEVDNKHLKIPVAPLSSWTSDWDMANRFAHERGDKIPGQEAGHGIVISRWMPVKDILHSGTHSVVHGQKSAHPEEKELVFAHKDPKISVKPQHISFKDPSNMAAPAKPGNIRGVSKKLAANEYDIPYEELQKGAIKKWITAGAVAANLGVPLQSMAPAPTVAINPKDSIKIIKPVEQVSLHPDLYAIKQIESSGGKKLEHPLVTSGLNRGTKAIGRFGIMPLQALEIINKSPALREKYPEFKNLHHVNDHDKIHKLVLSNPNLERELANTHWNRLERRFDGDKNAMAHAWLNGITGTLGKHPEDIAAHPYVQKFNKYRKMLALENPRSTASDTKLNKSENGQKFEEFRSTFEKDSDISKQISELMRAGHTHSLKNLGHFTHQSFVVGYDPENSWLVKVDVPNRPAVESLSGSQVAKEAAFYEVAKDIFGLENYTPKAVYGKLLTENKQEVPAVAIKMYPEQFKPASEVYSQDKHKLLRTLAPMLESGYIHKLAGVLYILGEADAHGQNILTDGKTIKLIDHGSAFAGMDFNPKEDENIFIPYFLRVGRIKDKMSTEQKYDRMPRTTSQKAKDNIRAFLNNVDPKQLATILEKYNLDPKPVIARWLLVTKLINVSPNPDDIIDMLWTEGPNLAKEVSDV